MHFSYSVFIHWESCPDTPFVRFKLYDNKTLTVIPLFFIQMPKTLAAPTHSQLAAVEICSAGASYNPDFDTHQVRLFIANFIHATNMFNPESGQLYSNSLFSISLGIVYIMQHRELGITN